MHDGVVSSFVIVNAGFVPPVEAPPVGLDNANSTVSSASNLGSPLTLIVMNRSDASPLTQVNVPVGAATE
jgi:hypothetical protein